MSIRAHRVAPSQPQDGSNPSEEVKVVIEIVGEQSIKNFKVTLDRALNCRWEDGPQEIKELSDLFTFGAVQEKTTLPRANKRVDNWK